MAYLEGLNKVDTIHSEMFTLAEIEEIAGYLMVYCNTHKPKESDE